MNYAQLVARIQDTTQNNDPTFITNIPLFVGTAEIRIHTEARLPSARTTTAGVTVVGNRSLTIPTGVLEFLNIDLTTAAGTVNLLPKSGGFMSEMYPVSTTQSTPKFYSRHDTTTLVLGPTPDLAYPVSFHYMAMPASIVTATNTWLGDNFPQLLLYACLCEAYVFMKGSPDIMDMYLKGFTAGINELKQVNATGMLNAYRDQ